MTVSFTAYMKNEKTNIFEFPPECKNDRETCTFNVGNANAYDILNTLGFGIETEPVAIDKFATMLSNILREHLNRKSPQLMPTEETQTGQLTIIDMGRRDGYIEEKIFELAKLTRRAKHAGATHIGWGYSRHLSHMLIDVNSNLPAASDNTCLCPGPTDPPNNSAFKPAGRCCDYR